MDYNQLTSSNYTMYFYEVYLYDKFSDTYIPIPVVINNVLSNGNENRLLDDDEWKLVHRFYLIDNLSGSGSVNFAKTIKLKTRLQNKKNVHRIYVPYFRIDYFGIRSSSGTQFPRLMISFRSEYYMDHKNVMKGILVTFIITLVLMMITVFCRMYVWVKLHPSILSPDNYCVWFLFIFFIKLFKYFGLFMFMWCWMVTAYWYIFFKMQYRSYILLPDCDIIYHDLYKKFNIIWGLAGACYGCYMIYRVYEQCSYDIFFIDWEHDKDILVNNMDDVRSQKYKGAWRGLHIANQFNLLQKERTISIPLCFSFLIFLWYYPKTHWNQFAQQVPNVEWVEKSPENLLLRHFVGTFILFICGICQYIFMRLIQFIIPMKKIEFLDLCSVANISVFLLESSLHGYYIHGQSPLGKADINLTELLQFLEEEGKGKIRGRGLTEDENDNLQSYEMYLSYTMRNIYDGLYYVQTRTEINEAGDADKLHNQSRMPTLFKYIPNSLNVQNIYLLNNFMNNQLKNKIEQVAAQSKIFVRDKSCLERFLEFPPSLDLTSNNAKELIFYRDPGMNFDDVLFIGMELEWLVLVVYTWEMWCIALHKYGWPMSLSIFMTYLMEKIGFKIRVFFGEKNVAKKAVIDNRFL